MLLKECPDCLKFHGDKGSTVWKACCSVAIQNNLEPKDVFIQYMRNFHLNDHKRKGDGEANDSEVL